MRAELLRGILSQFRADADGKMIGARERPQIPLEFFQEFHFDDVFLRGNEVTESDFEIECAECCGLGQKLIARSSREDHEIRLALFTAGRQADTPTRRVYAGDAGTDDPAAGCCRSIEQQ